VSPGIEASRRAQIPSPPAEPPDLVLWLDEVTRRFCGEPPQTLHADPVVSRYPAPAPFHDLVLHFLPPCDPHLISFGHRVHRAEPTCHSTPWRPRKAKTFRARSSPAPTQNKPQPTPAILGQESVRTTLSITHHTRERSSTGPRALQSSISPFISALTTHIITNFQRNEKKKRNDC
jgi:hypothetical protein